MLLTNALNGPNKLNCLSLARPSSLTNVRVRPGAYPNGKTLKVLYTASFGPFIGYVEKCFIASFTDYADSMLITLFI